MGGGVILLYIIKFIYSLLLPPGIFILLLFVLSIWFYRFKKNIARLFLLVSFGLYIFSIPLTGEILIHSLEGKYQPPDPIKGDVIVMLGGGATGDSFDLDGRGQLSGASANRLLTTARIYKKTHLPIIVSGGQVFKDSGNEAEIAKRQLVSLGVPKRKILTDNKSLNTEQNAEFTKEIMSREKFHHPILVTSAFHMKRSVLHFSKVGVKVVPFPTDYRAGQKIVIYPSKFVPADLMETRLALKEYLGMLPLL